MINYVEQNIDDLVPGTHIRIIENTAKADVKTVVEGKTVTILCVAPDFLLVPDNKSDDPDKVKFVRLDPNTLYPIDDPNTYSKYFTGESVRETLLTEEQKESFLFSKELVNACQIASDVDASFAIYKLAKRDGTSPDPSDKYEITEALQFALETLKTAKCGTIVPFHFNLADSSFGLTAEELDSFIALNGPVVTESSLDLVSGVSHDAVFLDTERDYEAVVEVIPAIAEGSAVVADLINATVKLKVSIDGETAEEIQLTTPPKLVYDDSIESADGLSVVGGLVFDEDVEFSILNGDLKFKIVSGTPAFSVLSDLATGALTLDVGGAFITNFASSDLTKSGANQSFIVSAVASPNPYVKVTSILEPSVDSGIKLLQGYDNDENKNFSPAKAKSFLVNFSLNEAKKTANLIVNGEVLELSVPVVADKTNKDLFLVSKKTILKIEDGVTIIFPKDLKVYDKTRSYTGKASIYYKVLEVVNNQYAYKISVVPTTLKLVEDFARIGAELTSKSDETFFVVPTVGILGDSPKDIKTAVKKVLDMNIRGTLIAKMSAGKQYDLGRHVIMPFGAFKSSSNIGGCKPEKSTPVVSFETLSATPTKSTRIVVARDTSISKGDLVEFSTYKRINTVKEPNVIKAVAHKSNATYIDLETPVDLTVFDKSIFDVTLNFVNTKDLKGTYAAFQYALIMQKHANKAPVRLIIEGTAEVMLDDYLADLKNAGITVINGDTAGNAKVEFAPTAAGTGSMFADSVDMGILFYILKKCRKIGASIEGTQMNDPLKQLAYTTGLRAIETDAISVDKLCSSCSITPDFSNLKTLRNAIEFVGVSPTQKVVYIHDTTLA